MYVYIIYEMTKDKFPGEHHLVLIWNVKHTSWKDLLVRDVMTPTFQAETIKWNGHSWLALALKRSAVLERPVRQLQREENTVFDRRLNFS